MNQTQITGSVRAAQQIADDAAQSGKEHTHERELHAKRHSVNEAKNDAHKQSKG